MNKKLLTTALAFVLTVAGRAESVSDAFCEALNVSGLTFTTGGDAAWTVTTENAADGVSALQSGAIGHSQSTWFQTTIEGPRLISFMVMVSSEGSCDPLVVSVDGNEKFRTTKDEPWRRHYVYLDSGTHTVRWTYQKDGSVNRGEDLARIDQLELGEVCEEITLPSNLTTLENYAFRGSRDLKRVVLPSALTEIPGSLFNGCTGLTEIEMPTALGVIGASAFCGCTLLQTVNLPNTVGVIGDSAFYGCSSLQAIDLPNTVSNLGSSVFYDCAALKTARLPAGLKTLKEQLFYNCSLLESVTLPTAFDKIEYGAFYGCQHLKAIELPETVTTIGNCAFQSCRALKTVHLPDAVTTLGAEAFASCDALETINIPTSLTAIYGNMFSGDSRLKNIEIPSSVNSIGSAAFSGCSSLTEMHLPASVTELADSLFYGCTSLKTVTCSESLTRIGTYVFYGCSALENFVIPNHVLSIGFYTFYGCSSLTEVHLPAGVTEIAADLFHGCSSLKVVTCSENLIQLGYRAFYDCTSLTDFEIPAGVTEIPGYCFYNCSSWPSVTIPEGVTRIWEQAFYNCRQFKTVVIPASVELFYNSSWSSYAPFYGCSGLQLVEFKGPPPDYVQYSTFNCRMVIPKEYGAAWFKVQGINNFSGYANGGVFTVEVISSKIRENDPTVMDVVYKVTSSQPTVKVRALAFEDGERSFAKVIRPETFIDGTAANVGDSVTANEEHTISWRVSSDWQTRLAKLQVEVFACESELLPFELMTIPASDAYGKMKVTWNALSENQWLDALYWLYASKDAGLTLEDGVLKCAADGSTLVNGTSVSYRTGQEERYIGYDPNGNWVGWQYFPVTSVPQYVFGKMGYTLIENEVLTYVNDELRLGLSPNGARQYGYKIVP